MFMLDGKKLPLDAPFTINGVQYPSNWLRLSSPEERMAVNIVELPDPVVPNEKYFIVAWNADGTITSTPRPIEDLRNNTLDGIKRWKFQSLTATDWAVTRAAEGVKPIPTDIATERNGIRAKGDDLEAQALAAQTVDQLRLIDAEIGA